VNLYGFVWNDGIRRWDLIGLIEVKRGDNTVVNDVSNSSPDQGSVAASFTVELEAFRKAAHGSIGPRCCYRGKIVNWHIVTHLPPNAPDVISSADFKKWYEKWVTQNLRSRYINAGHPIYEATQAHEAVHVKQLEARIADIEKHFKDTYGVESCYRTAPERDDAMNWAQKAVGAPREYTPHDMPMTDTKLNSEADAIKAEWEVYKRKYEN
jgi:hypothetical protein